MKTIIETSFEKKFIVNTVPEYSQENLTYPWCDGTYEEIPIDDWVQCQEWWLEDCSP